MCECASTEVHWPPNPVQMASMHTQQPTHVLEGSTSHKALVANTMCVAVCVYFAGCGPAAAVPAVPRALLHCYEGEHGGRGECLPEGGLVLALHIFLPD